MAAYSFGLNYDCRCIFNDLISNNCVEIGDGIRIIHLALHYKMHKSG